MDGKKNRLMKLIIKFKTYLTDDKVITTSIMYVIVLCNIFIKIAKLEGPDTLQSVIPARTFKLNIFQKSRSGFAFGNKHLI